MATVTLSFPTLTNPDTSEEIRPDASDFIEKPQIDPTIRSRKEDGTLKTRPHFTGLEIEGWRVRYRFLDNDNKILVKDFEKDDTVFGVNPFFWQDPVANLIYHVVFGDLVMSRYEVTNANYWDLLMTIWRWDNFEASTSSYGMDLYSGEIYGE